MGWESSGVVRFDLGPLLQGQTKIANTFNSRMTWKNRINVIQDKALKVLTNLKRISVRVPHLVKRQVYTSFARPIMEYGSEIFDNCLDEECKLKIFKDSFV